tara:strand:+ start:139 stop:648 length:510 start_codon:yes stop_codon:yes gene_type:complete
MKQIITILLLSITTLSIAQENVLLIYVDASESKENLIDIQNEVKELIANNSDHKLYLFISNGKQPFVTNKRTDAGKILNRLRIGMRPTPDHTFDTKKLNKAMFENKYISNINNITQEDGLDHKIDIYIVTAKDNLNIIEQKIVNPFLYSNGLKYGENNQVNCSVNFNLF